MDDEILIKYHDPNGDLVDDTEETVSNYNLPEKSKEKYMQTYSKFMNWKKSKGAISLSENLLLSYFNELSKTLRPSTLWAHYSMLKITMGNNDNFDLKKCAKLSVFLKRQSKGFKSKKSKVLSSNEVEKFLNEAPDNQYLATKVALIVGITGACRREELCNIAMNDVKEHKTSMLLVELRKTNRRIPRYFTISGKFYKIVKRYIDLRPVHSKCDRFFLNYRNGKCTQQPIGINKLGSVPKQIATYLNLPNPEYYTGHCFRRTSATLYDDSGADTKAMKRHCGLKSKQVPDNRTKDSVGKTRRICEQISESTYLTDQNNTSRQSTPEENSCPPKTNININLAKSSTIVIKTSENQCEINIDASTSKNEQISINEQSSKPSLKVTSPPKDISINFNDSSTITFTFDK